MNESEIGVEVIKVGSRDRRGPRRLMHDLTDHEQTEERLSERCRDGG